MKHTDLHGARVYFTEVGAGTDPYRDNFGTHVGDSADRVHERRRELSTLIGHPIVWMNQTHSVNVEALTPANASLSSQEHQGEIGPLDCDGVVIDSRQWKQAPALAVMTADCMPILLSSGNGVIGAVHAGRAGFLGGILDRSCEAFASFGVDTADIQMLIGPSICGRCYEVPTSMKDQSALIAPAILSRTSWGTDALDLPGAALAWAAERGITASWINECTLENPLYHSYRRDPGCGRFASVIATCRQS